ncbi:hypothetical protein HQN86_00530 [Pedobacter panaciterrae]|uniref:hypothetical protein n=1 Tax=Pedobacter panaciterrae TaxID=363849 RepID=UPI00155DAE68|nr:hypothetical protein [Pedobacter panaciterrae]NQX52088.1 hypothetical protein [Pedobacter panaciterrae]
MKIVRIKSPFLFFCFLFSFATSKVQAQTDFVIMNDGTKLMGEIKNQNLKKVKFIGSGEKKVRKFGPTDITEVYKTGRETFRSVGLPGNKGRFFLQVLENGRIKLYEYFKGGMGRTPAVPNSYGGSGLGFGGNGPLQYWYAQKDNGELVEVKSNQMWGSRKTRKDNFSTLIADNPRILDRYIKEDKFTFDFVRSLIEEYNNTQEKKD